MKLILKLNEFYKFPYCIMSKNWGQLGSSGSVGLKGVMWGQVFDWFKLSRVGLGELSMGEFE